MTKHAGALDGWLSQQRQVTAGKLKAILFEDSLPDQAEPWEEFLTDDPELWTPEKVKLIRALLRPSDIEVGYFLEDWGFTEWFSENPEESTPVRAAWLEPLDSLISESRWGLLPRKELFRVEFIYRKIKNPFQREEVDCGHSPRGMLSTELKRWCAEQ